MKNTESSGCLMRRRIHFGKFTFDIDYKKENLITQVDAMSRLKSPGHTTVALDGNLTTYAGDATFTQEQLALLSDSEVLDYLLLVHGNSQAPRWYRSPLTRCFGNNRPTIFAATWWQGYTTARTCRFYKTSTLSCSACHTGMNKMLHPRPCKETFYISGIMQSRQSPWGQTALSFPSSFFY